MRQILFLFNGIVLLAGAACGTAISLSPTSQTLSLGSPAVITVAIAGLGNGVAPSVGVFDINIAFDPTVLAFSNGTFGNQLDLFGLGDIQAVTPGAGVVNLFELSLESAADLNALQSPAFLIATLNFNTVGAGSSALNITLNALGDADGNALPADLTGASLTVNRVSSVPEPASVGPLGLALIGLASWRQIRRVPS